MSRVWEDVQGRIFGAARNLLNAEYVFAKTMADNPHFYTTRRRWPDNNAFTAAASVIQSEGERAFYGDYNYTELSLNGYYYWTMGAAPPVTEVINRKRRRYENPWDEYAHLYDASCRDLRHPDEIASVMSVIGSMEGLDVLDVGCGTGLLLEMAPELMPERYTGIDSSEGMLRELAAKFPAHRRRVLCCSAENFYPECRYDLVVSMFGGLEGVDVETVRKLLVCVKPGGRWVIMLSAAGMPADCSQYFGFTVPYRDKTAEMRELAGGGDYEPELVGRYHVFCGRRPMDEDNPLAG